MDWILPPKLGYDSLSHQLLLTSQQAADGLEMLCEWMRRSRWDVGQRVVRSGAEVVWRLHRRMLG